LRCADGFVAPRAVYFNSTPEEPRQSASLHLAETDRLLSTTRAVRKRLDLKRPVERSVDPRLHPLSMQAPTAATARAGAGWW
jgi:hypothetical protein